jgi:hypothetical protein
MSHVKQALQVTSAVMVAPVLMAGLLVEVIPGTREIWDYCQPGQASNVGLAFWVAFTGCGPLVVVVATIWTRKHARGMTGRILRIEGLGLLGCLPFAVFVGFLISSVSM